MRRCLGRDTSPQCKQTFCNTACLVLTRIFLLLLPPPPPPLLSCFVFNLLLRQHQTFLFSRYPAQIHTYSTYQLHPRTVQTLLTILISTAWSFIQLLSSSDSTSSVLEISFTFPHLFVLPLLPFVYLLPEFRWNTLSFPRQSKTGTGVQHLLHLKCLPLFSH